MKRKVGTQAMKSLTVLGLVLAVMVAASGVAHASTPSIPLLTEVYVSDINKVFVRWNPSSDTASHTLGYEVFRLNRPITQANVLSATSLGTTTGLSMEFDADVAGGEVAEGYVWYYAVRSYETTTPAVVSTISKTMSPNLHGNSQPVNVTSCTRCHQVHGAYPETWDYTYLQACYQCHASTTATSPETDIGDRSTYNIKSDFKEYAGQTRGSWHRSDAMADPSVRTECRACHTPHRTSYYRDPATGAYVAASSNRKMLRVKTGVDGLGKPTYTYYSVNTEDLDGGQFCLACHGPNATPISYVGDSGEYDAAAGDHTYPAGGVAHDPNDLKSNDFGKTAPYAAAEYPQIQCLVCHDKHASAADQLIAYRGDDTLGAGTYAQAELCFACHKTAGEEAGQAVDRTPNSSAPFAWNGRDVFAQFAKKNSGGSSHPVVGRTGIISAVTGTWSQTSDAEFGADTLVSTAISGTGSGALVQLAPYMAGYQPSGTVVTPIISAGANTLSGWGDLTFNGALNGGTLLVDVCDSTGTPIAGYEDLALTGSSRTVDLAFSKDTYAAIKLAATLTGTAAAPPNATDAFTHTTYAAGNFNTTMWTDGYLSGMTDPDSAQTVNVLADSFEDNNYTANPAWTATDGEWAVSNGTWTGKTGTYFVTGGNGGTSLLSQTFDGFTFPPTGWTNGTNGFTRSTTGWTGMNTASARGGGANNTYTLTSPTFTAVGAGAELAFTWYDTLTSAASEGMYVDISTDGTTFPTTVWSHVGGTANSGSGTTPTAIALPSGTVRIRLRVVSTGTRYGYFDNIVVLPDDVLTTAQMDLSGLSGVTVTGAWQRVGLDGPSTAQTDAGEAMFVEYSTDNGSTWTTGATRIGDGTTATNTAINFSIGSPTAQTLVRLRVRGAETGEYGYWDNLLVSGTQPATDLWPHEENGTLEIKAEGTFATTDDEGEFVYVTPPVPTDWISADNFVLQTAVLAGGSGTQKAGVMIRRGADVAGATAVNASMAGLYVTNGGDVVFQWRNLTTNSTATLATATGVGAPSASNPVYLRLERVGLVITAKYSLDGSTWTTMGSTATFTNTTAKWLTGIALTSGANTNPSTWAQATFDDFGVQSTNVVASTITPQLTDWSVTYDYYPSGEGSLTCANCHNAHSVAEGNLDETVTTNWWDLSRVSNPNNTKNGYASANGHQSGATTTFCLECHDAAAPTQQISATALVPYPIEFGAVAAPFFPTWNKQSPNADWAGSAHNNSAVQNMTPECSTCHDPHASDNKRLVAFTGYDNGANANHVKKLRDNSTAEAEEGLCYECHTSDRTPNCLGGSCHAGTRSVASIDTQTPFGGTYKHPIGSSGRHSDTETQSDLGPLAGDRHAECADCHDPHAAANGLHTAADSTAGLALRGATGIKPTYGTAFSGTGNWETMNAAASFNPERMTGTGSTMDNTDFEAYLCLKCHSSYSITQGTQITSNGRSYYQTDQALEFNPSNMSEHNVFGQRAVMETAFTVNGTPYQWDAPTASWFVGTWNANSEMTCTDCHTNTTAGAAKGPHGSSTAYMLADGRTWGSTTSLSNYSTSICGKCHTNLANSNSVHSKHAGKTGDEACQQCHIRIPHGWKRPRMLGYTDDPAPYNTVGAGLTGISLRNHGPNTNWSQGSDCLDAGCYGEHTSLGGASEWP